MSNQKNSADDKKIISVRIKRKTELPVTPPVLYSKQEVRRFVNEFVSSWIRGDIVIRFPTAAELGKKTPLSLVFPHDPSVSAELKIKEYYIDLLSVVAGIKPSSVEQQEKAIDEIFKMMLMFRSANRIEGKIISNEIEKRVQKIEEVIQNQVKLVDQITKFLFTPKKSVKKSKQKKLNN
ncbi:MAG: hypothetical protein GX799_06010 [Crenarchaeota archaeon]|jgi:hypothetical protein|nr:hypothetical protein [Thermoproteota archaeon]